MYGRRLALLIATSLYGDPEFRMLRAPAGDAEELQEVLSSQGDFDEVEILRNESKSRVENRIEDFFRSAEPQDVVLLYLSCHGIKNDRGELLFATCNTELELAESTAVSSQFVRSQLHSSQAGSKIVLLDCCYSGAFSGGLVPKSTDRIDLHQLVGRGTYVMTATSAIEYAYEGGGFMSTSTGPASSSLFTRAVLQGIRSGEADADGDGRITGDELYHYVCHELDGRQKPSRETQMFGEVYLARTPSVSSAEVRSPLAETRAPAALGSLLAHPMAWRGGPTGRTLRVPVGTHHAGGSWAPFVLELTEPESHLAVVGPTQSGKSQFLRTLLLALASDSVSEEIQIHVIDSESRFGAFGRLPHVAGVLGPEEHDGIAKVLTAADEAISARRAMFRELEFDSLVDFRAARRNRDLPDGPHPDVFLVIDRWEVFADENPSLAVRIEQLADKGTSFGLHVVAATRSWSKIPYSLRPHLRGRVVLENAQSSAGPAGQDATSQGCPFQLVAPTRNGSGPEAAYPSMVSLIEDIRQRGRAGEGTDSRFNIEQVLGTDPVNFDPRSLWRNQFDSDWLRVPIGRDEFGRVVDLDLNRTADGGTGTHGMIVGPPGSGATQTLSSLLFLLMLTHSTEDLNVVLMRGLPYNAYVDLLDMPHVVSSAGAPSLSESKALLQQQMKDIRREVARRRKRREEAGGLPKLVIALHNFVEALAHSPELVEQLKEVMVQGVDVGVHVVVHTHSISDRRFPEIEELCNFWIVHRTPESDSRAVLGNPMAARLPHNGPGSAFLKEQSKPATKFRAWLPWDSWTEVVARINESVSVKAVKLQSPLADALALGEVLGAPVGTERGLEAVDFARRPEVPIGLVEEPEESDVVPLTIPVDGNIAISGDPFSGKAFLARTIVLSMALTHTPEELHFYLVGVAQGPTCADVLSGLPHVAAVADLFQNEDLVGVIARDLLRLLGVRQQGDVSDATALVLVLEHSFDFLARSNLLPVVEMLARDGPAHRIYVIFVTGYWRDVEQGMRDLFRTRMQLDRAAPGTGMVGGRSFRAALPWISLDEDAKTPNENTQAWAERIAGAWPGKTASWPSLPPSFVSYSDAANTGSPHIVLGRITGDDHWAELDLNQTPHLLCLGERGSGRTNLLLVVLAELDRLYSAEEYHAIILDPKRDMLGEFSGGQYGYAAVREEFERTLSETVTWVEQRLALRRSGSMLRRRKIFLVLSDFELIATEFSQWSGDRLFRPDLFARLEQLADHGADLGFHMIFCRNSINIGDSLSSGLLGRLRSTDCATVVLSNEERANELVPGVRSEPRPPGRGSWVHDGRVETIQIAHLSRG